MEKESGCPNCAELWKRIDKLMEEKAKAKSKAGVQLVVSIVLFILILINFVVTLLRS
jgi:hypothetical protein